MAYVNLGQVMYPVGAIYQSWSSTSPASLFGGSWSQITEKFLYCANSAGDTGGESTHKLTINEMPSHMHQSKDNMWNWNVSTGTNSGNYHVGGANNNGNASMNANPWKGGGKLTTICRPILHVILGDALLNLFIGGGLVWHM